MTQEEQEIMEAWGLADEDTAPDGELDEGLDDLEDEDQEDEPDEGGNTEDGAAPEDQDDGPEPEDPFREERERIEAQGRQAQAAALDEQAASLNLKDPYTGKTITTHAELLAFQRKSREEKLKQVAKAAGLTDEELQSLIDQHPDVAAGRQLKAQMEAQQTADAQARAERALMADIAEIGRLMPGIDTKEAVVGHESWPQVRELMQKNPNLGLKQAFELANGEAIRANAGKHAQAAARRNAAGKNHLRRASGSGAGLPEVPAEVKAIYRAFEPGITEAEMRRHYAAEQQNN